MYSRLACQPSVSEDRELVRVHGLRGGFENVEASVRYEAPSVQRSYSYTSLRPDCLPSTGGNLFTV